MQAEAANSRVTGQKQENGTAGKEVAHDLETEYSEGGSRKRPRLEGRDSPRAGSHER